MPRATAQAVQETPTQAAASASSPQRVIKKYPNRRMYDTQHSSYITLAQVRRLVLEGVDFSVRDARTGADLTRSILLQIILEEETGAGPMFSQAMLANIIRFYGHAMQGFIGAQLERNLQAFMDLQARMTEQSGALTPELWTQFMNLQAPVLQAMLGKHMEQSQAMFRQLQEQMSPPASAMWGAFGARR